MAEGILGLGSGASSLSNDLVNKLKEAERASLVQPIENDIEDIEGEDGEVKIISAIKAKANELLEIIKPFDLFVSGGVTAFEQKSANVSGDAAVFNAADETALNEGTTSITITQLAKRDVFQSSTFDGTAKDSAINQGDLTIEIAGSDGLYSTTYTFSTDGKTYDDLVEEMNYKSGISASLEQIGDDSYRLVIKSAESGEANALRMTGAASDALGYTTDGSTGGYTEALGANTQNASNLNATVNGVAYDVSSNVITVDGGLKITAIEEGSSSISVENDTSNIQTYLQAFVNTYNELVTMVDDELYSSESKVEDKSTLRTMMENVKSFLFNTYGTGDDLSIFNFGFEVDKNGALSLDSTVLTEAISENFDGLKNLFTGIAEKEGLGTQLKTYLDSLDATNGLLYQYEETMNDRKSSLEEERDAAIEALDSKYSLLSAQFADYNVIISQFETSFSSLKLIIDQSTATG